ncbi:MAG: RNA polymerase sigma-I factor [Clostridiales bacterium]|nr:RNA polymerase sigma-I factor [Clostridiales bacterium]MCF8023676.1 RNA polymerase sigma-I factor [Clostridiales bacterium]
MNGEQDRTLNLINLLQSGDEKAREELIENYRKFIIKIASKYNYENIDIFQTDTYSIALIAFNEAANKYNSSKGTSFATFASQIIKRRLIDLIRSNAKFSPEISTNELPETDSKDTESPKEYKEELAQEITWFEKQLSEFNISMEDLVKETPKHKDTRCKVIEMARWIINDPEMLQQLKKRKRLPYKSLLFHFRCNPKTIQRHRKYIIAVIITLTLNGPSTYLREHVLSVLKGCDGYDS